MVKTVGSFVLVALFSAMLTVGAATEGFAKNDKAKDQGKSQVHKNSQQQRVEDEVIDEVLDGIFGENDKTVIEQYVREKGIGTKSLPPGIAKNVQRGKPLPPGIAKRGLPSDLEGRLPKLREGLQRIIVGDDVTIIEEGTRVVVDILKDVLLKQ